MAREEKRGPEFRSYRGFQTSPEFNRQLELLMPCARTILETKSGPAESVENAATTRREDFSGPPIRGPAGSTPIAGGPGHRGLRPLASAAGSRRALSRKCRQAQAHQKSGIGLGNHRSKECPLAMLRTTGETPATTEFITAIDFSDFTHRRIGGRNQGLRVIGPGILGR